MTKASYKDAITAGVVFEEILNSKPYYKGIVTENMRVLCRYHDIPASLLYTQLKKFKSPVTQMALIKLRSLSDFRCLVMSDQIDTNETALGKGGAYFVTD